MKKQLQTLWNKQFVGLPIARAMAHEQPLMCTRPPQECWYVSHLNPCGPQRVVVVVTSQKLKFLTCSILCTTCGTHGLTAEYTTRWGRTRHKKTSTNSFDLWKLKGKTTQVTGKPTNASYSKNQWRITHAKGP